jgi:outer membrane murein-binding lipoprotein Lpp
MVVLIGLAAVVSGCSSGRVAMQKKLTELNHQVTQLRASNLALQDRVDALESKAPVARSSESSADEQPDGRPSLAVVRLAPEGNETDEAATEAAAPPPDDGPRPSIKGDETGVEQVIEGDGADAKRQPRGSSQRRR